MCPQVPSFLSLCLRSGFGAGTAWHDKGRAGDEVRCWGREGQTLVPHRVYTQSSLRLDGGHRSADLWGHHSLPGPHNYLLSLPGHCHDIIHL